MLQTMRMKRSESNQTINSHGESETPAKQFAGVFIYVRR